MNSIIKGVRIEYGYGHPDDAGEVISMATCHANILDTHILEALVDYVRDGVSPSGRFTSSADPCTFPREVTCLHLVPSLMSEHYLLVYAYGRKNNW